MLCERQAQQNSHLFMSSNRQHLQQNEKPTSRNFALLSIPLLLSKLQLIVKTTISITYSIRQLSPFFYRKLIVSFFSYFSFTSMLGINLSKMTVRFCPPYSHTYFQFSLAFDNFSLFFESHAMMSDVCSGTWS
jgi:hypothetical protein